MSAVAPKLAASLLVLALSAGLYTVAVDSG